MRSPLLLASVPVAVLLAVGGRYGFHRDEYYFVAAGRRPAWGYPDQPPAVPLIATWWYDAVGGDLWAFRIVPALLAGVLVLLTWASTRELGGDGRAAAWAAAVVGTAATVLGAFHLFGTTAFDVTLTAAAMLLLARAVRTGATRDWLALGGVTAAALLVKTLPGLLLACCALALAVAGPRRVFRQPGPWAAALLALLGTAGPFAWQAVNGWPQVDLGRAIAAGSSGSSVDRWSVVPLTLTLTGPLTTPFWIAGLWVTARAARHRERRWIPVAAGSFLVLTIATGGKPYYLMGLVPLLVAAGAPAVLAWSDRRRGATAALGAVVSANAVVGALLVLPLLPARLAPVDVNYDLGEQVGWERLVGTVADAATDSGAAAIVTENYGEAGALEAARDAGAGLPPVFSGHNAYWWWGPPREGVAPVVLVGYWRDRSAFTGCSEVATLTNDQGVDNDEAGVPVWTCRGPQGSWQDVWPDLKRLG